LDDWEENEEREEKYNRHKMRRQKDRNEREREGIEKTKSRHIVQFEDTLRNHVRFGDEEKRKDGPKQRRANGNGKTKNR
jgi:Mg-chelatase subunit ChlD